jgi:transcriptional regulator NrdR family protein
MQLRCPDCDWSHTTVADRREVEHYERVIERGRDALVLEIERVRLEAMTEEVDRFVRALQRDDILPFDF